MMRLLQLEALCVRERQDKNHKTKESIAFYCIKNIGNEHNKTHFTTKLQTK